MDAQDIRLIVEALKKGKPKTGHLGPELAMQANVGWNCAVLAVTEAICEQNPYLIHEGALRDIINGQGRERSPKRTHVHCN